MKEEMMARLKSKIEANLREDRIQPWRVDGPNESSWVFYQAARNEWQDIMEFSAATQMEEETTTSLHASSIGALATPRYSLALNGKNSDTPIGYLEWSASRRLPTIAR
jgi:hypothetical protein